MIRNAEKGDRSRDTSRYVRFSSETHRGGSESALGEMAESTVATPSRFCCGYVSMDKQSLSGFRKSLKEQRDALQLRLVRVKRHSSRSAPWEAKDEGDRANTSLAQEMSALEQTQAENLLRAVNSALYPVNAFWSVTMYDGKTQLLIQNPINRYLINSPMLPVLTKNADGSLTIYIQKDAPSADKKTNWLPAPNGPIYLVMRLYWPKETPPSILPAGQGAWKPPAVMQAE
jgi:hypothetical protein